MGKNHSTLLYVYLQIIMQGISRRTSRIGRSRDEELMVSVTVSSPYFICEKAIITLLLKAILPIYF